MKVGPRLLLSTIQVLHYHSFDNFTDPEFVYADLYTALKKFLQLYGDETIVLGMHKASSEDIAS